MSNTNTIFNSNIITENTDTNEICINTESLLTVNYTKYFLILSLYREHLVRSSVNSHSHHRSPNDPESKFLNKYCGIVSLVLLREIGYLSNNLYTNVINVKEKDKDSEGTFTTQHCLQSKDLMGIYNKINGIDNIIINTSPYLYKKYKEMSRSSGFKYLFIDKVLLYSQNVLEFGQKLNIDLKYLIEADNPRVMSKVYSNLKTFIYGAFTNLSVEEFDKTVYHHKLLYNPIKTISKQVASLLDFTRWLKRYFIFLYNTRDKNNFTVEFDDTNN